MSDYKFYDLGVVANRFSHEHLGQDAMSKNEIKIVLPAERFSPIDYFVDTCDYAGTQEVELTTNAYERMKKAPYLRKVSADGEPWEKWIGEEATADGRHYPLMEYVLFKSGDGSIKLRSIKIVNKEYYYIYDSPIHVVIDYQG